MRQPFTLSIAFRYLRARSRNSFISFISLVSMLGIGLAVAVLIVVMSVINGFEHELQERILGMASDATLYGPDEPLADWRETRRLALERPDVLAAAPFIEGRAMAAADQADQGQVLGVNVQGIDPALERGTSTLVELLVEGSLDALAAGEFRILVGSEVAAELGVGLGDDVVLVPPTARVTLAGLVPLPKVFTVAGIFDVGMYEYDRGFAFVHVDDASVFYRTGGRASGLKLKVTDIYAAGTTVTELARSLPASLGASFLVSDWTRQHVNVFRSIQLTKPILFISLSLVIAVAAFNIISTLVMVVREKRGDIAILRSIGATPRNILSIFATQGTAIGFIGVGGGLAIGLVVTAYLQRIVGGIESWFGVDLLSADVYLIGELPTQARPGEIAQICVLALVLAVAATFYPASMAARQAPAQALRNE
jgi:lipoprotein-releasing system permease protein